MLPSLPYYKSNYINYFLLHICVLFLRNEMKDYIQIKFILFFYKIDRTVRDF